MDDTNILIEAHICAGANGVRMELPTASVQDLEEYAVFLCAQGGNDVLDDVLHQVPYLVWAEGLAQALTQNHWNVVHHIEEQLAQHNQSDTVKKLFPKMWASACIRHNLEELRWLNKFKPTVLNYKEAALQSVRGPSSELLKWALDNWKENAQPSDKFINTVFSDAVRLRNPTMIKTVLPFLTQDALHNLVSASSANPHVFGRECHSVLEKAVLEWSIEGTENPIVSKRKM